MKRILALAALAAALPLSASADPLPGTPGSCDGKPAAFHVKRAKALIRIAYDVKRIPDTSPATEAEKRAWREHRRCVLVANQRASIGGYVDERAERYARALRRHRFRTRFTPYFMGEPGFQWSAIPPYIVECETRGYYGHSRWRAANPSGAVGPYQLLGKGAPFPVAGQADKRAHHRIAASLWSGGAGASHWVCA